MRSLSATVRNLTVVLLAIAVSFGAYFFLYIQRRERLLTSHHLRLLLTSGAYASGALEGLFTNVKYAVSLGRREIRSGVGVAVEGKRKLIPGLEKYTAPRLSGDSLSQFLRGATVYSLTTEETTTVRLGVALDPDPSGNELVFVFHRPELKDTTLALHASLDELLAPTLPHDFFSDVLLVRSNGDVLLEEGESHLRIRRLDLPGTGRDSTAAPYRFPASQVHDVTIAGESYKLFFQPLRVPILLNSRAPDGGPGWRTEELWFMAGILPAGRFRTMSMEIPSSSVLSAVGLIALGLLALPLLKVRFMGPREALRSRDLGLLASAILIGASLSTFAILFFDTHERNAHRAEEELCGLSSDITSQLGRELLELDHTLAAVTKTRIATRSRIHADPNRTGILGPLPLSPFVDSLPCSPFMEMVFWVDGTGKQTSKWSVHQATTPVVSVAKREYFTEPMKGFLWPAPHSDRLFRDGRFVQSIRSFTTGRETAVLSRVYATDYSDTGNVLAAVEDRLRSVISPVLPPGIGFAIVDPGGRVQFHSEPVRNVREDFFDELGSATGVRGAVIERRTVLARTIYRTEPCILRVSPITGTPWSLVTFLDTRASRDCLVTILGATLVVDGVYLAIVLIICWLALRRLHANAWPGEPRRIWYWPSPEHRAAYRGLSRMLALLALASAVVVLVAPPPLVLASIVVAPPATLVLLVFMLRRVNGRPRTEAAAPRSGRLAYGLSITLAIVLLGVVPAFGIFRVVHDEMESEGLESRELAFFQAMNARRIERRKDYEDVQLSPANRSTLSHDVLGDSATGTGSYTPAGWNWRFERNTDEVRPDPRVVTKVLRFLMAKLGDYGVTYELDKAEKDSSLLRQCEGDKRILFATEATYGGSLGLRDRTPGDSQGPRTWRIEATIVPLRPDALIVGLELLTLGLLLWIVRAAARDVFLGDFVPPPVIDPEAILETAEKAILLRFPLPADQRARAYIIDSEEIGRRSVTDLLHAYPCSGKKEVLLRHFDHRLREPEIIRKKLELLEGLNALDPPPDRIRVESSIEPLYFLTARHQDHYAERKDLGISIDRWSAALEDYVRLRRPPDEAGSSEMAAAATDARKALEVECQPLEQLGLGKHVRALADIVPFERPRDVVEAVLDLAKAHYRMLWTSCSSEEKLLLYHIAKEGLVNRNALNVLLPLFRRGLVRPPCRLMSESFRQFVLTAEKAEVFAKWQRRGEVSTWSRLKSPLLFALGALAVFFFATQREALNRSLGLLAALTAVLPATLSVLGSLNRLRHSDETKPAPAPKS